MGGFRFEGPTKIIKYLHTTDLRCKCPGVFATITQEQEDKFIGKTVMTLKEFHSIFDDKYVKSHIHVKGPGIDPNILYFTVEDKTENSENSEDSD